MVKVEELKNTDWDKNTYRVTLFADTKDEMSSVPLSDIEGLPEGSSIEMGSTVITADGDVAFYKSDGTWNWVE